MPGRRTRKMYDFDGERYLFNLGKLDVATTGQSRYYRALMKFAKDLKKAGVTEVIVEMAELFTPIEPRYPKPAYRLEVSCGEAVHSRIVYLKDGTVVSERTLAEGMPASYKYEWFLREVVDTLFEYGKWHLVPVSINGKPVVFITRGKEFDPRVKEEEAEQPASVEEHVV